MNDPTKHSLANRMLSKIHSEGYCCMWGYLTLCRERGETPQGMAENLGALPHTIRHHYRQIKAGKCSCSGKTDCLRPIIEELQKTKAP